MFLHSYFVVEHMAYSVGSAHGVNIVQIVDGAFVLGESELLEVLFHLQTAEKLLLR